VPQHGIALAGGASGSRAAARLASAGGWDRLLNRVAHLSRRAKGGVFDFSSIVTATKQTSSQIAGWDMFTIFHSNGVHKSANRRMSQPFDFAF